MTRNFVLCLTVGALLTSCGGLPKPACDAAMLTMQLSTALPGDTVMVGACEVTGNFVVPAGITVAGVDRATSIVHATSGAALTLTPGAMPTGIHDLTVRADGVGGITATGSGSGEVTLTHVTVHATKGYAVGVENVTTLTATDVALDGPITSTTQASALTRPVTPATTATHGLVVVHVTGSASLTDVTTTGFAQFGALFLGSTGTWTRGNASQNVGTGVMVDGGSMTLDTVDLLRTFAGPGTAESTFAAVVKNDGALSTLHVNASNNEGFAFMQDKGSGDHLDLIARSNTLAAFWLEEGVTAFHLHGTATDIGANGFAGIVGVASSHMTIEDAHIYGTHTASVGSLMIGDGIHLSGAVDQVTLRSLNVENNARAQIIVDAGDPTHTVASLAVTGVTVNGTGVQLGCIDQNGVFDPMWDMGVARSGATVANDAAFMGTLGVAGIIGPSMFPSADAIAMGGLASIH